MTRLKILPTSINGKQFRITYEGCDVIKLDSRPTLDQLDKLFIASNVAYIRVANSDQLFFVNKTNHQLVKLNVNATQIKNFDTEVGLSNLEINESKSLTEENLNNLPQLIEHQAPGNKKVHNVEVKLTLSERNALLRKLYDKRANTKNSAYTYIFQTQLAKYQAQTTHEIAKLKDKIQPNTEDKINAQIKKIERSQQWMNEMHSFSSEFIRFEHFINNPSHNNPHNDPEQSLDLLLDALNKYEENISAKLDNYPEQLDVVKNKLLTNISAFRTQIEILKINRATKDQIQYLFSVQTRDLSIPSLGAFMADQMIDLLDAGIEVAYKISNRRFIDLFEMPLSISTLSEAKKMLTLKSKTLDGMEYNDTYSPIPEEMLMAMTEEPISTLTLTSDTPSSDTQQWFSLKPYLNDWNPTDLDEIICLATDSHFNQKETAPFYVGLSGFGASVIELMLIAPIRLIALVINTGLTLVESILRPVLSSILDPIWQRLRNQPFFAKNTDERIINRFDRFLSQVHAQISPVFAAKRWWNSYYKRKDTTQTHQELLDECKESSNFYHQIFTFFNPQFVSDYIQNFLASIFLSPVKLYQDLVYTFSTVETEKVYSTVKARQEILQHFRNVLEEQYTTQSTSDTDEPYPHLRYCHINEISSPLEVFREIMLTLDDTLIDSMFRKSPGFATLYFMVSITTFGMYLAPASALAVLKSFPAYLKMLTDFLSIHFTGKSTALGLQQQMVACFLEWKLGFFTTELLMEIQRGNFDFFNEIIKEPEQVTMAVVGLVGMGMLIQFLPFLPTTITVPQVIPSIPAIPIYNFYAEIVNIFIEEAKGCAAGTIGLNWVEYAFLGLKFSMLMHSMLTGAHQGKHANAFQQLAKACSNENFLKALIKACENDEDFNKLSDKNKITYFKEKILTPQLTQLLLTKKLNFTQMELTAFTNALAAQIPKANKEFQAYLKSSPEQRALIQNKQKSIDPQKQLEKLLDAMPENTINDNLMPLEKAHQRLQEAIQLFNDRKNPLVFATDAWQVFSRLKEANKFYDHLDKLFDNYNAELLRSQNADLCINKYDFLDVFYNKYCYQSSNNFLRFLLFFPPFYMIAVSIREIKRLLAWAFNKPSVMHQIQKSYHKDLAILLQVPAIMARTYYAMARALSYTARFLFIATVTIPSFILAIPYFLMGGSVKKWFQTIDKTACYIALHKTPPLTTIQTIYAKTARIAGSNEDIIHAANNIMAQLKGANDIKTSLPDPKREGLTTHTITNSNVTTILARYDQAHKASTKKALAPKQDNELPKSKSQQEIAQELKSIPGTRSIQACLDSEPNTSINNCPKGAEILSLRALTEQSDTSLKFCTELSHSLAKMAIF